MSGCGQAYEPAKKLLKQAVDNFLGLLSAEVEIQVKEGGTDLHKTLVYKGLKRIDERGVG